MGDGHNFRQLRERILALSQAGDWEVARKEGAGGYQQAQLQRAGLMEQEDIERIAAAAMTAFMFSKEAQRGED